MSLDSPFLLEYCGANVTDMSDDVAALCEIVAVSC